MRYFVANYSSEGNSDKGTVWISADSIVEAQNKFFDHLKTTNLYQHMWKLSLVIEETKQPPVLL
jgi:hypothetical protein